MSALSTFATIYIESELNAEKIDRKFLRDRSNPLDVPEYK